MKEKYVDIKGDIVYIIKYSLYLLKENRFDEANEFTKMHIDNCVNDSTKFFPLGVTMINILSKKYDDEFCDF